MRTPECMVGIPELEQLAAEADDLDVKICEARLTLREFLAAALSYMPDWMRALYVVRMGFVRLLGVSQDSIPEPEEIAPEEISFTPGEGAAIFTVCCGEEERFWLAEATDAMITGHLGVVVEPLGDGLNRFHFVSGATFRRPVGRFYYAVITPFHHLVVSRMLRHALKQDRR